MKRTVFVCCVCLWPVWAGAQSTCETRVDAHPRATTNERVNYCLHAPSSNVTNNNPGLVFSGVSVRHPDEGTTQERPTAREGYFKQDTIQVTQNFVETQRFPQFTNSTLSEREIWTQRQADYQTQQPVQTSAPAVRLPQEKQFVDTVETKAGLKARTKKPGRRLIQPSVTVEEQTVTLTETVTQEVAPAAEEYTYDTAAVQPYAPAVPEAQDYVPAEPAAQPYEPAGQEEIPVGTSSYAPAN